MKFRRNKIKREHSIIKEAIDWLEELSKLKDVTDIIPGVIDVTHSKERGITYQYETPTGCKILLKSGGSIQEAFVVTTNPQAVQAKVQKIMEELDLFQAALDEVPIPRMLKSETEPPKVRKTHKQNTPPEESKELSARTGLLAGIQEEYQMVEINQGLKDALLKSLANMQDFDDPQIMDMLDEEMRETLKTLKEELEIKKKSRK